MDMRAGGQNGNAAAMTTNQTLGDLLGEYHLRFHCRDCGHHAEADIAALIKRFGADYNHIGEGRPPVRCGACCSRNVGKQIAPIM